MQGNRATKSGFAREAQDKNHGKYDSALAAQLLSWVSRVTGSPIDHTGDAGYLCQVLRDGQILAKLANSLQPGSINIHKGPVLWYHAREYIHSFLKVAEKHIAKCELFESADLVHHDEKHRDPIAIVRCLGALKRKFGEPGLEPKGAAGSRGGGNPFLDALEKLKEDYNHMQAQLSGAEVNKMNAEKEQLKQHYDMYVELCLWMQMEMQKQSEVALRMSALLQSMLQYVPAEQQQSTLQAMERAKQISLPDLHQLSLQMYGIPWTFPPTAMTVMGGALGGMAATLGAPGSLNMGGMRPPQQTDDRPAQSSNQPSSSSTTAAIKTELKKEAEDDTGDDVVFMKETPGKGRAQKKGSIKGANASGINMGNTRHM